MKREILFRGQRIDNGKWVCGYGIIHGEHYDRKDNERKCSIFMEYDSVSKLNYQLVEVNPETVGQFTGLLDKNKTKIFEGDIITLIGVTSNENRIIRKVEYIKERAQFMSGMYPLIQSIEIVLVIGNIHDNPNLK